MMAQLRLRLDEDTKVYMSKKLAEGKTKRAALRCLKTYIARAVYRFMLDDVKHHPDRWCED